MDKKERDRISAKERYWANPEKKLVKTRAYYNSHKEWAKDNKCKKRYGIPKSTRDAMERAQMGRCAICGNRTKLGVDHNHQTGKVRELLCDRCNMLIGQCGESISTIQVAIAYIELHSVGSDSQEYSGA